MVKQRFFTHLAQFGAAGLLALLALALFAVGSAQAGPPAPIDIPLTQPDGTTITARQWGDEWQHGLESADGYTLVQDEASGYYVYAAVAPDGTLVPAKVDGQPLIAGQAAPLGLMLQARPAPVEPPRPSNLLNAPLAELSAAPPAQANGSKAMLVILAEFNNLPHTYDAALFRDKIFGASGSIRDFYLKASFGQLVFNPAQESSGTANDGVVGWVKLNMDHPNPNPYGSLNEQLNASLVITRAALETANTSVNFAAYDFDHDGFVTAKELQVVIIASGYEHSYTQVSPGIWAHQTDLDYYPLQLDGVNVAQTSYDGDYGGYAIFGEVHFGGPIPTHIAQIGVMAHEIGHLLGLPDLYDTGYDTFDWQGAGKWSIMGSGSWNGPSFGDLPALPDAFLKSYMGWITPRPTNSNGFRTLIPSASANPYALMVGSNAGGIDWQFYGHSGTGQYWLVENRQQTGYDAGLPGCGLLIWHVHEDAPFYNDANAKPIHPLVALEQADGLNNLNSYDTPNSNRGDNGDPYPGTFNRTIFGPGSIPSSSYSDSLGSQTPSNFTVTVESTACQPWMYLNVNNGAAAVPMPNKLYLGTILNGALTATGTVRANGAPLSGQSVQIMYASGPGQPYAVYGSPALTDANGRYALPLPYLPAAESKYYVLWTNTTNNTRLGRFECNVRTGLSTDHTCDMDVTGGISLLQPPPGAGINPPTLFTWTRRAATSESYALQLYRTDRSLWVFTDYLGYTDRYTLTVAPSGTALNNPYYWGVRVRTPSGVGFAFEKRPFTFTSLNSPPLELQSAPGWHEAEE